MNIRELLDSLPPQFDVPPEPGRVLLLDGDLLVYKVAYSSSTIGTAITGFKTQVETAKFLTRAEYVRVHLTSTSSTKCNRWLYPTVKPYQANRTGVNKAPLLYALRAELRAWVSNEDYDVIYHYTQEADDGLIQDSYLYRDDSVLMSGDKDLQMTPFPYWRDSTREISVLNDYLGYVTKSGRKAIGHGRMFFWLQLLMGDAVDNVRGLVSYRGQSVGLLRALDILSTCTTEEQVAHKVLEAFIDIHQNGLAEAECLWLHRSPEDLAYHYLLELNPTDKIKRQLDKWHKNHTDVINTYWDIIHKNGDVVYA